MPTQIVGDVMRLRGPRCKRIRCGQRLPASRAGTKGPTGTVRTSRVGRGRLDGVCVGSERIEAIRIGSLAGTRID